MLCELLLFQMKNIFYRLITNFNRAQSQYARIVDGGNFTKALLKQDNGV